MKYAIIEISGRQFWIEKGKYYDFNRISEEKGTSISINKILLANNDGDLYIGTPQVKNIKIEAIITEHLRGQKLIVYKMRPKKKTRKKQGHRQDITRVLIEDITKTL
jgi:large subunit ribosomal protein L21